MSVWFCALGIYALLVVRAWYREETHWLRRNRRAIERRVR